jgi:E3 ubiquitin-protein ligase TRIP12
VCVIRIIESFASRATESLEGLLSEGVVKDIMNLLVPGGPSTSAGGAGGSVGGEGGGGATISSGMMTLLLRALSTAAKNSPKVALTLLKGGMACTVYTILAGLSPPNDPARLEDEQGGGEGGQGVESGLSNMAVMQNLAGRPKETVEEAAALSLR